MEENNQTKKIEIKKAFVIIILTLLFTILFAYVFYNNNFCKDGDNFRLAKKNELWAIISDYDLLNTPGNNSDEENLEKFLIARLDSVTQVAIIETNFEWKKVALLIELNVDTIGWVNSDKINCAKNLTRWLEEHFVPEDTTLIH